MATIKTKLFHVVYKVNGNFAEAENKANIKLNTWMENQKIDAKDLISVHLSTNFIPSCHDEEYPEEKEFKAFVHSILVIYK